MVYDFGKKVNETFTPDPDEEVQSSILQQYERVIMESLITSFGLDGLIGDLHGGDVDTIHNVRQMGQDGKMTYKNKDNAIRYEAEAKYESRPYHADSNYIKVNRKVSTDKKDGKLLDAYTGKQIQRNEKSDLDHVISAKSIHEDRGRVLAGLKGTDLANSESNLKATNPHTNRQKRADSMDTYLEKHGHEYDEKQKENMRRIDREARIEYEKKITKSYYTSRQFQLDIGKAAVKTGLKMGTRQVVGLFFTEIWFSVKEKFADIKGEFSLSAFFKSIGQGIEAGVKNAMAKYKEILSRLMEGAFAGFLSSITTTLCNIFFTTAQNVVKIIRQLWVSLVQAAKILFINPDNLPFGERMRAVARILSVGAGVVFGSITSQWIGTTAIGAVPVLGDIVQTFMGTLVTGIVSCSLIHFIDKSQIMNKLVNSLNAFNDMEKSLQYYQEQALYFEEYAAALMNIDLDLFEKETGVYIDLADAIEKASDQELQKVLHAALGRLNMKGPWGDDFNQFMRSKSSKLVFE